jgi:hypothetical protein
MIFLFYLEHLLRDFEINPFVWICITKNLTGIFFYKEI